jgi:hypothetical protein
MSDWRVGDPGNADYKVLQENGFLSDSPCESFDRVALVASLVPDTHCAV